LRSPEVAREHESLVKQDKYNQPAENSEAVKHRGRVTSPVLPTTVMTSAITRLGKSLTL